jgi:hypothetical protein
MIVRSFPPFHTVNVELTLCFSWCSGCRVLYLPYVCLVEKLTERNYAYGPGHPMKPHRIRMCHSLIMNYGLYKNMEIYVPLPLSLYHHCYNANYGAASETGDKARNVPIPSGRLHRLSLQSHTRKHGRLLHTTNEMYPSPLFPWMAKTKCVS